MAGMTLAGAVCAGLVARGGNGGQLVTTSLYRQGAYTISFLLTGHSISIGQRESMANPCMNNYTAGDGRRFWLVGLQGDRHWPALCGAVQRLGWLADERFATARARAANAVELIAWSMVAMPAEPKSFQRWAISPHATDDGAWCLTRAAWRNWARKSSLTSLRTTYCDIATRTAVAADRLASGPVHRRSRRSRISGSTRAIRLTT